MEAWLSKNRRSLYFGANALFVIVVSLASTQQSSAGAVVVYLSLLFALVTAPLCWLDRLNGRYLLLAIFMALYFVFFGMLDLITLLVGAEVDRSVNGLSDAECAILVGGVCALAGYLLAAALPRAPSAEQPARDWPNLSVLLVGLALWLIGSASIIYFQVYVVPEKTIASAQRGLASMSAIQVFAVMLGNLVAPLGLLILAYGYAKIRSRLWLVLILALLAAQVVIAFVTDIRGYALLPVAVVIVALTLVSNKVPKAWIAGSILGLVLIFPILSAYRSAVTGERGLSKAAAVQDIGKLLDIVFAYQDKLSQQGPKTGGPPLFERASLKFNMEREFARTGVDVPFQEGRTLVAIPLAFIPRIIWPDKPDVSTGQLFNHEIIQGEVADTYISPSHVGELYWNYGWPGLVLGMLAIGALLGFIAAKCSLAERISVTRLLILLATVQYLCWGFEGVMSVSYICWLRSVAAIGLLHLLFAKTLQVRPRTASPAAEVALPRFPNLLR